MLISVEENKLARKASLLVLWPEGEEREREREKNLNSIPVFSPLSLIYDSPIKGGLTTVSSHLLCINLHSRLTRFSRSTNPCFSPLEHSPLETSPKQNGSDKWYRKAQGHMGVRRRWKLRRLHERDRKTIVSCRLASLRSMTLPRASVSHFVNQLSWSNLSWRSARTEVNGHWRLNRHSKHRRMILHRAPNSTKFASMVKAWR